MHRRKMHAIIGDMEDNKTHIVDKMRDFHFDNIKAVLIFLVVLGHVFRNLGANGDEYLVYKIIYSFHMPAFLFISGYFMKYNPKRFFAGLVPLYLLFQMIQTLEHMLLAFAKGLNPMDVKMDLFTPRWTLWYLVVLMIYQLLIPLIDTDRKKHQLGFLVLSVVLGLTIGFTDDTDNFFALSRAFVFLPFFLLGFYERKNHYMVTYGTDKRPGLSKLISAAAGGVMIIFFWKLAGKIDPKDFFGSEDYADLNALLWRLFGWLFACVWIMILLNWVPKKRIPFSRIGQNTMSIYLLHGVLLILLEDSLLKTVIQNSIPALILLSVAITVGLSWGKLDQMLRKVRVPTKSSSLS